MHETNQSTLREQTTSFFSLLVLLATSTSGMAQSLPRVVDERLHLELMAESPAIETPIGMAIDNQDRLFVLESHTHDRTPDYEGPPSDLIKVFSDQNGDGKLEEPTIFADGIKLGLNLAFSPTGTLYVVCAREVLALEDHDSDGKCDEHKQLLRLVTEETYSHNCLLGITFDNTGMMYVSRGNTASRAYQLIGTDESRVSGYGDGGAIVRCTPEGTQLEEFATGFWNPFEMKFDHTGRLLCVDNDPDARGPNRLLHVVLGGDYGYRSLYGGGGNHPFQGWDGTLPGTLPYISGTGEAPCDLIDAYQTSLPTDYRDSVLVTVWNENSIENHKLVPAGKSLTAQTSALVKGGDDFRPVAIEADSLGNVYFTDWVNVSYPVHGSGRIWKLSVQGMHERLEPQPYFSAPVETIHISTASNTENESIDTASDTLLEAISGPDPFARHKAVMKLSESATPKLLSELAKYEDPNIRMGALLASRRAEPNGSVAEQRVEQFLTDADAEVRRAAVIWAGSEMMTSLRPALDRMVRDSALTPVLFQTYLSATECLEPKFVNSYRNKTESMSSKLPRKLEVGLLEKIAQDASYHPSVRALAVGQFNDLSAAAIRDMLLKLASAPDMELRLAAVRKMGTAMDESFSSPLSSIAGDVSEDINLRAESILALSKDPDLTPQTLCKLLSDENEVIACEAARALRRFRGNTEVERAARERLSELKDGSDSEALIEQLNSLLGTDGNQRPSSLEDWQRLLAAGGDVAAGRRVFYSTNATCSSCHTIGFQGGELGPDLSNVAQSVDRAQIIRSILRPSDQFPPQYQAWIVLTADGKIHTGLQLDHKYGGAIELFTTEGRTERYSAEDVDEYYASEQSVMPTGLETNLTVSEMRDLVAFLDSLH